MALGAPKGQVLYNPSKSTNHKQALAVPKKRGKTVASVTRDPLTLYSPDVATCAASTVLIICTKVRVGVIFVGHKL